MATVHLIEFHTDGANKKQGPGGGGILTYFDKQLMHIGQITSHETTNQQMEAGSALWALFYIYHYLKLTFPDYNKKETHFRIRGFSDSEYTVKGNNEWMWNWAKKGWTNNTGKPISNMGYWKAFYAIRRRLQEEFTITKLDFQWYKGHSGIQYNEACDKIATESYAKNIYKETEHFLDIKEGNTPSPADRLYDLVSGFSFLKDNINYEDRPLCTFNPFNISTSAKDDVKIILPYIDEKIRHGFKRYLE
jgi:ribonuclease HI